MRTFKRTKNWFRKVLTPLRSLFGIYYSVYISLADPGERPGGPSSLFSDQTGARRAEKIFFGDPSPNSPSKGLDDQTPSTLSEGLDPALYFL